MISHSTRLDLTKKTSRCEMKISDGTNNRRIVEQYFYNAAKICDIKKQSLGVIMLDLNKFKEVNDEYGHHKGDELKMSPVQYRTHFT